VFGLVHSGVAPAQRRLDLARRARIHPRADVQRALVIEESHLHGVGRDSALDRLLLHEVGDRGGVDPRVLIQTAIDADRPRVDARGLRVLTFLTGSGRWKECKDY